MSADTTRTAVHPFAGMRVVTTINRKGGTGKSETVDLLEAIASASGRRCKLIDVDDANSGLARRVGRNNVIKVSWDARAQDAASWVTAHAPTAAAMLFDLGSGIESTDLPVMAFLARVWKLLRDGGAEITILIVVGTNAPLRDFVDRIEERFGDIAGIAMIFNNQDGSRAFPASMASRTTPRAHLGHSPSGLQQVRLTRQEPLSAILAAPSQGFKSATALLAHRAAAFARQPLIQHIFGADAADKLDTFATPAPRRHHFAVTSARDATDERLAQNEKLAIAERALRDRSLSPGEQLVALECYREAIDTWRRGSA